MVLISFLSFFDLGKTCEWQLVLLKDWIQKGVRLSLKKLDWSYLRSSAGLCQDFLKK